MGRPDHDSQFEIQDHRRRRRLWRIALFGSFVLAATYLQFGPTAGPWLAYEHTFNDICAQPSPPAERSNYSSAYDSPEFKQKSITRLSGAVKIPTMSFDDMGPVDEDERWAPFPKLHQYLQDTYPFVHTHFKRAIVGGYSLIYTLVGSDPGLKPLLLTGHLDVVPAITSLDRWTYPPFEGKVDGEWAYGRGVADCKNNVIGVLSAVEHLLETGWKPTRTLLLAFGQDEEISGPRGATSIARYLEDIYGPQGIAMIVDEGGMGLDTIYGKEFALPGVAEKGYLNAIITVDMSGGHSSVPTPRTSIGILSKIVSEIEDSDIFQPQIRQESPIWGYLSCVAEYGDSGHVPTWIKEAVSSPQPDFSSVAKHFAATSPANRYLIQTSKAATVFHAGVKANALAESATVNFNSRIDIFSSRAEVANDYVDLVKPIARKYSLTLDGESYSQEPSIGNITFGWDDVHDPSPISPSRHGSVAWDVFSKAVQASFGHDVITSPSAMTGNTDTRHYWNLTRNIYRWSPARTGTRLNIHTVDEKIKIDTHVEGVRFYTELIVIADNALEEF
ncbi:carboxypeptidase S [Macrolepiota fuliginosa MF-IS2]|uniref:Carboxypeptidase S n=1 Tax=Macrolepiota fuliginosa MF-IS2 TaxID=1400762 RepID=A0A9P6BXR1_9AGAR|nr:carboxypeptidase S [Macrolepiota fuliginosa MF-IS2]